MQFAFVMQLSWTASNTFGIEAIRARITQGCLSDLRAITSWALDETCDSVVVIAITIMTPSIIIKKQKL